MIELTSALVQALSVTERIMAVLILALATAVIYQADYRSYWNWWERASMLIGSLLIAVLFIDLGAFALSLLVIMLGCWFDGGWPSPQALLLLTALLLGVAAAFHTLMFGQDVATQWSSNHRWEAVSDVTLCACTFTATLLLLAVAWLCLEASWFGHETNPSSLACIAIPLSLPWLLPIINEASRHLPRLKLVRKGALAGRRRRGDTDQTVTAEPSARAAS